MRLIKEIEIRYFRSIYSLKLKNIEDCLVFSGKNDSGKSNILKALNLFFNNQTDWKTPFDFGLDFNLDRLSEVREESIKGKQFIQISITFRRGNSNENTLPETFTVKKQWDRYSTQPKITDDLEKQMQNGRITNTKISIIKRSLSGYLNRINFEYVPAIKDIRLFDHVINLLQKEIISISLKKKQGIAESIRSISEKYQANVSELTSEFLRSSGIETLVGLPFDPSELFHVLNISTSYGSESEFNVSMNNRGDGIRLRYLPSLYNFLAQNHKGYYVLGFEEPENSMEYSLSSQMAKDFQLLYSVKSQIFITSHSPAFLFNYSTDFSLYRIYKDENKTKANKLKLTEDSLHFDNNNITDIKLMEEIGLSQIQKIFHKQYIAQLEKYNAEIGKVEVLEKKVLAATKPVLFTEGKTDVSILTTAWNKLYQIDCPFIMVPVETTEIDGGDGGYTALNRKLESVRPDEKLQLGLYDNDEAGNQKGFQKLNRNFTNYAGTPYVKKHINNKAFALILPVPNGYEEFEKYKNLPIEFYFNLNDLQQEVDGRKLIIIPFQQKICFHGEEIGIETKVELHLSKIDPNTKKYFAETIVPTFSVESFNNFRVLFELIRSLINESVTT